MSASVAAAQVFHPGSGHFRSKRVDQSRLAPVVAQTEHPRWSTLDEAEALMWRDGYLVVPGLFSADQCARLLHRLVHDEGPDERYEVDGWCFNKHIGLGHHRDPSWLFAVDPEPGIDVLDRVLGSDCTLMGAGLWSTGPGRSMPYHIDHAAVAIPDGGELPPGLVVPAYIAVMIAALEDQDLSVGPTAVVPGSHRRPPRADGPPAQPVALILRRGDGLILRGDLCHGAAPNTGPRRRTHFHSTWANAFIAPFGLPMRNAALAPKQWPPELAAACSPRQRRVLGAWPHPNGGREAVWSRELGLPPVADGYDG